MCIRDTGVIGAQQGPQLLLGPIGGLGAQHDTVAFELGLERTEGVLDLPPGVVELGQLGGGAASTSSRVLISAKVSVGVPSPANRWYCTTRTTIGAAPARAAFLGGARIDR